MSDLSDKQDREAKREAKLLSRARQLEADAALDAEVMVAYEEQHAELDRRAEKLERELNQVRKQRLDTYTRWWHIREQRNRAQHRSRRLRQRLSRLQRGRSPPAEQSENGQWENGQRETRWEEEP